MKSLTRSLAVLVALQACVSPVDPPAGDEPRLADDCRFDERGPRHPVTTLVTDPFENADGFVPTLRVQLDTPAGDVVLNLQQNVELLAPGYREQEWRDGDVVTLDPPRRADFCQYIGDVQLADGTTLPRSTAAISTCNGVVEGLMSVNGSVYELVHDDAGYGLVGTTVPSLHDEYSDTLALAGAEFQNIELYMVSDTLRRQDFSTLLELRNDSMAIANSAAWVFRNGDGTFDSKMRLVLVGHLTFQFGVPWNADRIGSEVDSVDLLRDFRTWYLGAPGLAFHDMAMLLTGDDPDGSIAGLGWIETACVGNYDLSFTATYGTTAFSGVVAAHELGHNLGSDHDVASCGTGGVMSEFLSESTNTWSTCSTNAIDAHLAAQTCLDDPAPELVSLRGAHGDYVVAELNGAANANRPVPFAWETFELIRHSGGLVSLRSYHNKYLVAELNGAANANRTQIGNWEKWTLQGNWDGTVAFRSFHNTYLVAEPSGALNANRTARGAWESFVMRPAAWWINR